jgi:hypothetical protein
MLRKPGGAVYRLSSHKRNRKLVLHFLELLPLFLRSYWRWLYSQEEECFLKDALPHRRMLLADIIHRLGLCETISFSSYGSLFVGPFCPIFLRGRRGAEILHNFPSYSGGRRPCSARLDRTSRLEPPSQARSQTRNYILLYRAIRCKSYLQSSGHGKRKIRDESTDSEIR